jgi:hypothetical protein
MPKLDSKTRRAILKKLTEGVSDEDLQKDYNISSRSLRRYRSELGLGRKKPVRRKKPTQKSDIEDVKKQIDRFKEQDMIDVPKPKKKDLDLYDLIGKKAPKITKNMKLDPNKNYCGNCIQSGKVVVLESKEQYCPICGVELEWGR